MKSSNILYLLLLFPFFAFSNPIKKHEKSKTLKKEYSVNKNATLFIDNKYGDINVTTWNENKIEITVKITVSGNDLNRVENKLDAIDVDFEATKNLVEARTRIENNRSNWSWWGNNNNVNFKINYFVNMPKTNNADFNNKYGGIELGILEGKANINCDYGKIEIEKLLNNSNTIELDYCSNSEIQYLKSGSINADYSKLEIIEADEIKSNLDYTTLTIEKVNNFSFNSDYGNITVDEATNVTGNSDYAGMRFGTIKKNLKIDTDYGGIKVKNLAKNFENVTINTSYASVKIETPTNNNFNFTVSLSYAEFGYPEHQVQMFKSIKKSTKKYYEGTFGNGNSNSNISIKSSYGGVSIKTND
ncbi:hypothetical protein [Tenacibaculum sp. IB213877]|uniref:hypothetical protein n=1 Tax=Tenacibaculum sp. IB213877 TaxID=3097351 RepID=UPI002A5AAC2E|nr:hypothetical protein [Tenacibaculum sp. IB213877]MDY0779708.1 hypothetical protein [Tenacibaculum sp. IB213877]